ncbi:MAG: hypothetical protein HY901_15955 [Deltaproteobacteria bacterium]|nr:hypothetical protein [Deltaproteobacteria bacterium]
MTAIACLRPLIAPLCALGLLGAWACGPVDCDPTSCPNGCCSADGKCLVPEFYDSWNLDRYCGVGGRACDDCSARGLSCASGVCASKCNPTNCDGCCDGDTCRSESNASCGTGGVVCKTCRQSEKCSDGACVSCRGYGAYCSYDSQCCSSSGCSSYDDTCY